MCLAQGHNAVAPVRLKPAAPRSQVKHSTTEPLRFLKVAMVWKMTLFLVQRMLGNAAVLTLQNIVSNQMEEFISLQRVHNLTYSFKMETTPQQ